jgi:hypothetical protein
MRKQTNPSTKAHLLRSAFYLLLLLGICAIPFALAQRSFDGRTTSATSSKQTQRTLSFADRVAYQRAIEPRWITGQVIYADGGASLMNPEVPPEIQIG